MAASDGPGNNAPKPSEQDIQLALTNVVSLLQQRERAATDVTKKAEEESLRIVQDMDSQLTELQRKKVELEKQIEMERAGHEAQKAKIASTHVFRSKKVKLDVRGHRFTTSLSTLTRYPDNMLGAMFSGRHQLEPEENGTIFIDRDGTHFRYILNFFCDGETSVLPSDKQPLTELLVEASYYQIQPLVEIIRKKLSKCLPIPGSSPFPDVAAALTLREKFQSCNNAFRYQIIGENKDDLGYVYQQTRSNEKWYPVCFNGVTFRNIWFRHQWDFSSCEMRGVSFIKCNFDQKPLFIGADLTDAAFEHCRYGIHGNLGSNCLIMTGATCTNVTYR